MDLLRILTAGSVDDGKSSLIGRMLVDSDLVYEDHLDALRKASGKTDRTDLLDFALLCDGLKAEREQGITIDVSYKYFATAKRKFIVADCPGHVQYTKNMATGASVSELAIILIDAQNGVLPQTKRHSLIITMMGIKHIVIVVNKMDLVDYRQDVYDKIRNDYVGFADKLEINDIHFIPISALNGDNVVSPSTNMPWYSEGTVLGYLENVHVSSDRNLIDLRIPVQYVVRTDEFRGYAGPVASGIVRKGDTIKVLGKQHQSVIKTLKSFGKDVDEAFSPQPVTIELSDDIDISRGDILVRPENTPPMDDQIESMVVWMDEKPLLPGGSYYIKHNTKMLSTNVDNIVYKIDLDTARRASSTSLGINDVGRVLWSMHSPTIRERYGSNRSTGRFIIIDKISNATVGAGIVLDKRPSAIKKASNCGMCIWLTGLSGSGKTTIAKELVERLRDDGLMVEHLDGDMLRGTAFASDIGFDRRSRDLHIARVMFLCKLLVRNGITVVASFISPYVEARNAGRRDIDNFIEIYVKCDILECERRDPKGLYKKVRNGEINHFTGIDDPYEEPSSPHLIVDTADLDLTNSVSKIYNYIRG